MIIFPLVAEQINQKDERDRHGGLLEDYDLGVLPLSSCTIIKWCSSVGSVF